MKRKILKQILLQSYQINTLTKFLFSKHYESYDWQLIVDWN